MLLCSTKSFGTALTATGCAAVSLAGFAALIEGNGFAGVVRGSSLFRIVRAFA
jgi:hypothetical protein